MRHVCDVWPEELFKGLKPGQTRLRFTMVRVKGDATIAGGVGETLLSKLGPNPEF